MQKEDININSIIKTEYLKIQNKVDELFLKLSYISFVFSLIVGVVYENLVLAIFLAGMQFLIFFLSKRFITNRTAKTYTLGIIFGSWSVVFMLLTRGYYAAGFIYFAYYVFLIIYQEKKLLLIGPIITFLYNISFFFFLKYGILTDFITNNFKNDGVFGLEELIWLLLVNLALGFSAYTLTSLIEQKTMSDIRHRIKQEEQIKTFERYKEFAVEIESNNLKLQENTHKDDYIGQSLNNIKKKLSDAIKKDEQDKFLSSFNNEGIDRISKILRTTNIDLNKLSYLIVSELVKYLGANQGAIFIAEEELNGDKYLELKAAYAYERKKNIDKKILIGEGVIGTAFIENKSVYLTKLPENYLFLKSGLGKTKPRALIAQTISYNDKIVGILEIASLKKFKEYELKFVELISEYIASTIISEKAKIKTSTLLDRSNKITNDMQIKENKMNDRIQELEIKNEEYKIKIDKFSEK